MSNRFEPKHPEGWHVFRRETGLLEHTCPHGIGHPNYYSVARLHSYEFDRGDETPLEASSWWIHGCDGCCGYPNFPGRKLSNAELADRLHDAIMQWHYEDLPAEELAKWAFFTVHDLRINEGVMW